jgi:hypothetical protein
MDFTFVFENVRQREVESGNVRHRGLCCMTRMRRMRSLLLLLLLRLFLWRSGRRRRRSFFDSFYERSGGCFLGRRGRRTLVALLEQARSGHDGLERHQHGSLRTLTVRTNIHHHINIPFFRFFCFFFFFVCKFVFCKSFCFVTVLHVARAARAVRRSSARRRRALAGVLLRQPFRCHFFRQNNVNVLRVRNTNRSGGQKIILLFLSEQPNKPSSNISLCYQQSKSIQKNSMTNLSTVNHHHIHS